MSHPLLNLRIEKEIIEDLKEEAEEHGCSLSNYIRALILFRRKISEEDLDCAISTRYRRKPKKSDQSS